MKDSGQRRPWSRQASPQVASSASRADRLVRLAALVAFGVFRHLPIHAVNAADICFVVGELARVNERHELLAGRLDLSRLGTAGHSFGGAAAAQACRLDDRIRAGASIDGGLWKAPAAVAGAGPFLQLFGEHPEYVLPCEDAVRAKYYAAAEYCAADRETTIGAWQALHERARPGASVLVIGAGHASFIEWPMLPLWRVASDYLLDFFGEHLCERTGSLLAGEGPTTACASTRRERSSRRGHPRRVSLAPHDRASPVRHDSLQIG